MVWNSPPKILRLASPYVVAVLGDAVQIMPLRSSTADALVQARIHLAQTGCCCCWLNQWIQGRVKGSPDHAL